jgi:hypothetical protein
MLSILVLAYIIYSMERLDSGGAIRLENFNHPMKPFWHMDCPPGNMNLFFIESLEDGVVQ